MRGKVRGRHLMRPLIDDRAWRPVAADPAPAIGPDVPEMRGRQAWLLEEFVTAEMDAMRRPVFPGRPRTRPATARIQQERDRARQRLEINRQWLWRVKRETGCAVCGFQTPTALEFHHVNHEEKCFPVGVQTVNRSKLSFYREMAKCVLICANCHRLVHHEGLDITTLPRFDPWACEPKPS